VFVSRVDFSLHLFQLVMEAFDGSVSFVPAVFGLSQPYFQSDFFLADGSTICVLLRDLRLHGLQSFGEGLEVFFEFDFLSEDHLECLSGLVCVGVEGIDEILYFFFVAVFADGHPVVVVLPEH